jgi:branched-subunit amino acid transport protein
MSWWAIVVLAVGTYAMKAAGPLLLGGRGLPPAVQRASTLLAATLLAALVAISTVTEGDSVNLDGPLIAGVASGAFAVGLRAPFVVVVVVAAAVAALLRLVG